MKIDIHVHTKKTKKGDSVNRNVDVDRFSDILKSTEVKILAITNHNHFDLSQYESFKDKVQDHCQIWPGIELDILEEGRKAHLIVIVNPNNAKGFHTVTSKLLEGHTPDSFTIQLKDVVEAFDKLDSIYIAHYNNKSPNLIDEDIEKLINLASNEKRILKEATNSISAGIYISHGHSSIYGSDVHNWNNYIEQSEQLPELRLPVDNFEQFCLLLEKHDDTINTLLNKKSKETIDLYPFEVPELLTLEIYDDINILFGSKGTGKSKILEALVKHYNTIGHQTSKYESNKNSLFDSHGIGSKSINVNMDEFGIEECEDEFTEIKNASEESITSITSYKNYFAFEQKNQISKKIKVFDFQTLDSTSFQREFDNIKKTLDELVKFDEHISDDNVLQDVIGDELYNQLTTLLEQILNKVKDASGERLLNLKTITLFNHLIETFISLRSKKTHTPEKPTKTGFHEYASNRIKIERCLNIIFQNISKNIEPVISYVGNLGEKGELKCQTNFKFQDGKLRVKEYNTVNDIGKEAQRNFAKTLGELRNHIYENSLFEKITELNETDNADFIDCTSDLLQFYKHFILDGEYYKPSSGESLMVMLHNELKEDKYIYIIDEPEKSLGNDYISEVIVPLLNEKARSGKKIIIATHDANIAVRTLPYHSIFRKHDIDGYDTFTGNPFSNNLTNINNDYATLDWKEVSMRTLEGGRDAFGERGKIYGNV